MLLNEKIILVTGATSGIGYHCAIEYAKQGAIVIVAGNKQNEIDATMDVLGREKHDGVYCDVSNSKDVENTIAHVLNRYKTLDVVHNNAGIVNPAKPLHNTTETEWDNLMGVNLKSIYLTTKFAFEALRESKGCILNTSSLVAELGQEEHAAYSATKGAVNTLTKSMAVDYARFGIRVNSVCPAWVRTPAVEGWIESQTDKVFAEQYVSSIHPLGYCPTGEVIADACVFLLSPKARFITGCNLPVSGGAELGYRRLT